MPVISKVMTGPAPATHFGMGATTFASSPNRKSGTDLKRRKNGEKGKKMVGIERFELSTF